MFKLIRSQYLYLLLIIVLAFGVRLYKINNPVADWHSWRQADTAAVARDFYKEGFNPLLPKFDDMSDVSGRYGVNLGRFRFVEFPIYPAIVYATYLLHGGVDETLARLVSVFFSLGSLVLLYLITRKYFGVATALLTALLWAVLPYNIYYSRVILPEPSLLFFCLGMFYFVDRWIKENGWGLYLLSLIFMACAFLTKPMAIFYLLPLAYSYWQKERKLWPVPKRYWGLILPALLPFGLWRLWILRHPEGIPASSWLINGNKIRFKPAFWRWIIGDRFGREILSPVGTFLFFFGLLIKPRLKETALLSWLGLALLLYLIYFATGNVQHDYYQALIIPGVCIFVARGFVELMRGVNLVPRLFTIPAALLFLSLTLLLTWPEVKGLYQINNYSIVDAGKAADKLLPKKAIVLAPYQGDTSFLYQTNRPGFPYTILPIDQMVERFGVTNFVSVNYDDQTNQVIKKYKVLVKNPQYVIVDLTHKASEDSGQFK